MRIGRLAHFVMQRKQLLGIARRAEAAAPVDQRNVFGAESRRKTTAVPAGTDSGGQ